MLTKAQVKDIRSLAEHKYRKQQQAYVIEGDKLVREWLESDMPLQLICCEQSWYQANEALVNRHPEARIEVIGMQDLVRISFLQAPNSALIVAGIPENSPFSSAKGWCIAVDKLQDPGNMGTIIRIADWYGIKNIVASPDSVDYYNPKVVQSAMGGHLRVQLHTRTLTTFLDELKVPVLAAALDGESIYTLPKYPAAVLLIGNESKGISPELLRLAGQKITIPRKGGAESLNAAVAAGIICAVCMPQ